MAGCIENHQDNTHATGDERRGGANRIVIDSAKGHGMSNIAFASHLPRCLLLVSVQCGRTACGVQQHSTKEPPSHAYAGLRQ